MKKPEVIFNLASLPLDAVMFFLATLCAYFLRPTVSNLIGPVLFDLTLPAYFQLISVVTPFFIAIFALWGLYTIKSDTTLIALIGKVTSATTFGLFIVIVLFFFNKDFFPSRFIVLASWVLVVVFIATGRSLLRILQRIMFERGVGLHKVLLVGKTREAEKVKKFISNPKVGFQLVGIVDASEFEQMSPETLRDLDEVICCDKTIDDELNFKFLNIARDRGLKYSYLPNTYDVSKNSVEIENNFGKMVVISLKNSPLEGWGKVIKRFFDITISLIAIIFLSPIFLAVYLAVKINSPGPAVFSALRVGQNERPFLFHKFRSMFAHLSTGEGYGGKEAEKYLESLKENTEGRDTVLHKIKNDPRVTSVGRFLRRTKLDELPQFFNVLIGSMSLVGPRPHLVEQVEDYKNEYPRIFSIKPGLFGLTQLSQLSNPVLPFEEEIELDIYYIENWALWLDVKILATSAYRLIFARGSKENY